MTHDILQSDIILATRLIGDQRPDEEILQALAHRGVDRAKAAKLLDDLHSGRKPEAQSALSSEMTMPRRSRSKTAAREAGAGASNHSQQPRPAPGPKRQSASPGGRNAALTKVVAASVLVLAIATVGVILFKRAHSGQNAPDEPQTKPAITKQAEARPPAPAKAARAAGSSTSAPLVLELQPDGLHIGGSLVTGGNLLTATANLLGAPTRTNQAASAGTVIYAYDHHGLLIYSQPGGRTNHIVLDCEATGGANGTTSPFAGTLRVEDQVIGPDTDSQTLAGIKKLGLGSPTSGGTIWGGRYNTLGLVFAYLKSPRRPSLIEIDLK
jgi:hypothetical protein